MNSNSKKTNKEKQNSQNKTSKSSNKNSDSFQVGKASKTSFIWILILVSAVFLSNFFTNSNGEEIEVQYSQYRSFLSKGLITKAQIVDEVFHGELSQEQNIVGKRGSSIDVKRLSLIHI